MDIYNTLRRYIKYSIKIEIPWLFAAGVIFFLMAVCTCCLYRKKRMKKTLIIPSVFLPTYIFLILASTVFCRPVGQGYLIKLQPLWTLEAILFSRETKYIPELIVNIAMFIPIGFFLPRLMDKMSKKRFLICVVALSVTIEVLQFATMRGLAETDDVIHNTVGAYLGLGLYKLFIYLKEHWNERTWGD